MLFKNSIKKYNIFLCNVYNPLFFILSLIVLTWHFEKELMQHFPRGIIQIILILIFTL